MAIRPLLFGILFIAVFVGIIVSLVWVDPSQPTRQSDPLAPTPPAVTDPTAPAPAQ
ncbi:hypothetical protein [Rhizobium sp. Rhizsp82]|uniref:hypothetical protein n=1 Tax=Rhizobium sp. Rhizsp82 TaxID=3243057 RepID=UPI0039B3F243